MLRGVFCLAEGPFKGGFTVPVFNLIAVILFELSCRNGCLTINVTTPKQIVFLRGLWGSYIPGFNLIAVILFELSRGIRCLQTERWMDRRKDSAIR